MKGGVIAAVAVVAALLVGYLAGGAMAGGDETLPGMAEPTQPATREIGTWAISAARAGSITDTVPPWKFVT